MEIKQEFQDSFFEQTKLPIISINLKGDIVLWSKGSEELLGYTKEEAIKTTKNFLTKGEKELLFLLQKTSKRENLIYKTQQEHKKGFQVNLIVSATSIVSKDGALVGLLGLLQNIASIKSATLLDQTELQKETKRTFKVIRNTILSCLLKGKMTINQVSNATSINWKTVEKHLTYLIGKKMIEEVFSSEYVRIFELTPRGREFITNLQREKLTDYFKIAEVNNQ